MKSGFSKVLFLFCMTALAGVLCAAAKGEPLFQLHDPGSEKVVDYTRYGEFTHVGAPQYRYLIRDRAGLAKAVGEGIYPNVNSLLKDPMFQKFKYNGKLEGSLWDFVNTDDIQANFYRWASAQEQPGVKQFYAGDMLEKAGLTVQAIKAYQSCVVHFPKTSGSTFWKTPWYIGPTALDRISYITRTQPELGMRLEGGRVNIRNCFDDDVHNDIVETDPGKIITLSPAEAAKPAPRVDVSSLGVKQQIGKGRVKLEQYANGHWRMLVKGKPFIMRAIAYGSTPVGKSPDDGSLVGHRDWMLADQNKNDKIDGPYDSWVDKNRNEVQDKNERVIGDWKLLKDMGVNSIRLYHRGYNKAVLKDLHDTYGIYTIMGDYLGAYTIGSGADWYAGTDYSNPEQQKKMMQSVREMVEAYKEEPYVLLWVLGNENNYGNANNSRQKPDAYYTFVNKVAKMIKSMDPSRPVAICNGDLLFLDKIAKLCPDIDIYGANAYRGSHGFGDSLWRNLQDVWKKPAFITEYGCPAYHHRRNAAEAEELQADYLRSNWLDIEYNTAGHPGAGNSLGGVLFQWMDEWWKAGPPPQYDSKIQDIVGQFGGPFPDGWSYEEWYGIVGQGTGKHSPFMRHLRKAYFLYKDELWNPKKLAARGIPE
jgi:hypothetical protein